MDERPDVPVLTNPGSDRVKAVRALSGRSSRSRAGQFLVEGPQAVREAIRFAADAVLDVYLTSAVSTRYPEIAAEALDRGLHLHLGSDEALTAMSANCQGVLAVVRTTTASLDDVLTGSPRLVAVLSNVRDPGNAGTVIRAADAAGADAVVLTGSSVELQNPKVVRATAGSLFHVPVVTGVALARAVDSLHRVGLTVLAADGEGDHDLDELLDAVGSGSTSTPDLAAPTAWLLGNEAWGLPADDLELADAVVRVPIRGHAESLNLASAAAVCLFASARAQR